MFATLDVKQSCLEALGQKDMSRRESMDWYGPVWHTQVADEPTAECAMKLSNGEAKSAPPGKVP